MVLILSRGEIEALAIIVGFWLFYADLAAINWLARGLVEHAAGELGGSTTRWKGLLLLLGCGKFLILALCLWLALVRFHLPPIYLVAGCGLALMMSLVSSILVQVRPNLNS